MNQLMGPDTGKVEEVKKVKKKKKKQISVWLKQPNGKELREIAELTEVFEDAGMIVDPNVMRRVIVNDADPEYVNQIKNEEIIDRDE